MGFPTTEARSRTLPVELRAEHADLIIGDRVENILTDGGFIYSNGNFGGFGIPTLKVSEGVTEELKRGRIVVCKATEISTFDPVTPWAARQPVQEPKPKKVLVIPPGSNQRLSYRTRTNKETEALLLQGIDKDGKPATDNLYASYGFLRFFEKMARKELLKQGVTPTSSRHSYRKAVLKRLEKIALANVGLGEMGAAAEKMKQEMSGTADKIVQFINGTDH